MFRRKKGRSDDDSKPASKFTPSHTGAVGSHPGYAHVQIKGSCIEEREASLGLTSGFFVHTPRESPVEPGVIMYDPTGQTLPVQVSAMQPGLYQCHFTPVKKGAHKIMVCYGHMNVPGSPVQVSVVEPRQSLTGSIKVDIQPSNVHGTSSSVRASNDRPSTYGGASDRASNVRTSTQPEVPVILRKKTIDHRQSAPLTGPLDLISEDLRTKLEKCMLDVLDFKLGGELGKGEFGTVFTVRVTDRQRGAIVAAAKNIKKTASGISKAQLEDFFKEAILMQNFRHANVLELLGVAVHEQSPYILFPVMAKGNLRKYLIKMKGTIEPRQLLHYGLHVAQGMEYIASLKFVHRDLAARNCLLSDDDVVKISDFGLARDNFEENYVMVNKTRRLPIKWMAPEILDTWTFCTPTDVWAFGVLLWEIFAYGRDPYDDLEDYKILMMSLKSGKTLEKPDTAPSTVYDMMLRCWNLNPEGRPTFTEIVRVLNDCMTSASLSVDELFYNNLQLVD